MSIYNYSFIITIYNVERYLERCIESVLNQTENDYEIILINDGSTDNSSKICEEYKIKYENISVVHTPNKGVSSARNRGILEAKGNYLLILDADDFIESDLISYLNHYLDNGMSIDVLTTNYRKIKNNQLTLFENTPMKGVVTGNSFLKFQLENDTSSDAVWRNVYRKQFIIDNKLFFKENYVYEDNLWTPVVFLKAKSVIVADFIFYNYMIRPNSITQQKNKTKHASDLLFVTNELVDIYQKIQDTELRNHLNKDLYIKYFTAFFMGKHLSKKYVYNVKFMRENAHSRTEKFHVFIFSKSRFIFYHFTIFLRKAKLYYKKIIALFKK